MKQIKIVIIDDHSTIRSSLKSLIEMNPYLKVVGEADNGEDGISEVIDKEPNLVLMDWNMPRCGGVCATRVIKHVFPGVAVIGLSMHEDGAELLKAGADAYVSKSNVDQNLLALIKMVAHCGDMHNCPFKNVAENCNPESHCPVNRQLRDPNDTVYTVIDD